jgi:hypothetical protein
VFVSHIYVAASWLVQYFHPIITKPYPLSISQPGHCIIHGYRLPVGIGLRRVVMNRPFSFEITRQQPNDDNSNTLASHRSASVWSFRRSPEIDSPAPSQKQRWKATNLDFRLKITKGITGKSSPRTRQLGYLDLDGILTKLLPLQCPKHRSSRKSRRIGISPYLPGKGSRPFLSASPKCRTHFSAARTPKRP